jgi:hypothetical protein
MAPLALFSWPFIAAAIFAAQGRMRGIIWGVLIGALFLPEKVSFDLPGLPPYNKETAIVLGLLVGLAVSQKHFRQIPPRPVETGFSRWLFVFLAALLLLAPVLTVATNRESLIYGPVLVPGLGVRDLITLIFESLILLIPFHLARRHLGDPEGQRALLTAFAIVGFGYSFLVLFEARMSPQLHRWIYGFFQHVWAQHVRGGGFRPIVFLPHGIFVGIFLLTCLMSAFVLQRGMPPTRASRTVLFLGGLWFIGVLVLSRNFGAMALAFVFLPLIWFLGVRSQIRVAGLIVALVMVYPALRQAEAVPIERFTELVGRISAERAASFQYRLDNERAFMERAWQKPIAGWGPWGRWRIRDEVTGQDISTSDGRWISIIGERGWLGFVGYFGLLAAPVMLLVVAARNRQVSWLPAGIALILTATLLYQLPNNTIGAMTMLLSGSLYGFVSRKAGGEMIEPPVLVMSRGRGLRYTRFGEGGAKPMGTTRTPPMESAR